MQDLKLLLKAGSIIQREAVLAELSRLGIEAVTSPRDMSRKMSDTSLDLALEGYSVFFDGFVIYVHADDFARADEGIKRFLAQSDIAMAGDETLEESPHFRRFFFCGLFSVMLPGLMHVMGIYHLFKAAQHREKMPVFKFVAILPLYAATLVLVAALIGSIFH